MKVGRVAIITRGRYAGKKVRQRLSREERREQEAVVLELKNWTYKEEEDGPEDEELDRSH